MSGSVWWSGTSVAKGSTAESKNAATAVCVGALYQAVVDDYRLNGLRSLRNVEGAWKNHLQAVFENLPVVPFRPSFIKRYIASRKSAGAANATVNREIALLKRMCSLAVEQYEAESRDNELVANLICWSKIKALDESDNVREQIFPSELYDAFAIETAKVGLWFRAMFEFSYARGWRPKSLKQLQVKQIDLARRTVRLTAKMTKNKKPCEIGMTDIECELVKQCVAGKKPDDFVFTRDKDALGRTPKKGGHIVDYRRDWKKVCKAVGVEPGLDGLIFYDTKRAGITNLIDDGFDVKEAMSITGHSTESAFRRYHKIANHKLLDAARRIERGHQERQRAARYKQAEMFGPDSDDPTRKPS